MSNIINSPPCIMFSTYFINYLDSEKMEFNIITKFFFFFIGTMDIADKEIKLVDLNTFKELIKDRTSEPKCSDDCKVVIIADTIKKVVILLFKYSVIKALNHKKFK